MAAHQRRNSGIYAYKN